jgi:hypothetical protein
VARNSNTVRVCRPTLTALSALFARGAPANKLPWPKADLAASVTRIPDVGAGAFALWWLSAEVYPALAFAVPPTGTAATIAEEAVRLFGERLHLAPEEILFVFYEVEPNLPRFPVASIRRDPTADA